MDFVKIDAGNKADFSSVLPEGYIKGREVSIGAVEEDVVCGAVSFSFDGEEYMIDWIYVEPQKRLMGVGKGLIEEVRKFVSAVGLCPIRMLIEGDEESGLYEFVLSLEDEDHPIVVEYSHDRYTITTDDFAQSPAMDRLNEGPVQTSYKASSFWSLDKKERAKALSMILDGFSVFDEEAFKKSSEKDCCLVEKRNDEIESFILVQRLGDDTLQLSYLYSIKPKALAAVLQDLYATLLEYGENQTVFFEPITDESRKLAKTFFADAKKMPLYEVEL